MNQPAFLPLTNTTGPPSAHTSETIPSDELVLIWEQIMAHSPNGLVGMTAVRDTKLPDNPIVNFRYRFLNQIALRDTFLGQPMQIQDVVGRLLTDFFPDIRSTPLWQTYLTAISTGVAQRIEQQHVLDQHDAWFMQSAAPFGQDGLLLSYSETSDLHHIARRLARQTALLNGVLDSSPNAIAVFEAVRNDRQVITDFQVSLTNNHFEELTEQAEGFFTGITLSEIYPITPVRLNRLRQMIDTGNSIRKEEFVPTLGRWLDITLTKLNDGFVATLQDVTPARQVSQQLRTTINELHQSNQNLEQFAYVASHDLQEPLRKIVSFGDVLTDQHLDNMSESAADLVRRMQKSATRMRSLVQDLLTYARLAGKVDTFSLIDLNHLLGSVADDLGILDEPAITCTIDTLPPVWGDTTLLRQLFQNLLSNALKFQPPGNPVQIQIQGHPADVNELPKPLVPDDISQTGRRYAVIDVIDNGIGFDERYLDRIFTIFQRLHGRMRYSGTGMGLAICRKVVDIHRGYITAISQEGAGAVFRVFLPMM
ncbi:sensor histidine kinase [Spirosoma pomorum]